MLYLPSYGRESEGTPLSRERGRRLRPLERATRWASVRLRGPPSAALRPALGLPKDASRDKLVTLLRTESPSILGESLPTLPDLPDEPTSIHG